MKYHIENILLKIDLPNKFRRKNVEYTDYLNKKIVTFGDSITWYDRRTFRNSHIQAGEKVKGYQSYVIEKFGCKINNQGVASWTLPQILSKITSFNYAKTDIVTITSGANDHRTGVIVGEIRSKGSSFDKTTFSGALQTAIEHVFSQKTDIKIFLMTPIKGWFHEYNTVDVPNISPDAVGVLWEEYSNAIIEIGNLYDIPVLDWYNLIDIKEDEPGDYLGDDPLLCKPYQLHPTHKGYKKMGRLLVEFMEQLAIDN